jgi:hypothetical protein
MSRSSAGALAAAALGLRPRLAPVAGALGGLGRTARLFLDGLDGFGSRGGGLLGFLDRGFCGGLTAVLVVGLAGAAALAGVFDAGTGRAFGSGLAAGAGFTDLAVGAGARAALVFAGVLAGFFATGAGVTGFLVF